MGRLCYRKRLMLFSLKLQRDNRKNALTVDPVKGKTGKKLHFSPHCGDETTTYYNRAFGKGFLLYFHISVCAGSTAGLSFPCFFVSWAVAFVRYPFGGPVSCWCAKNRDGADTEGSSRNMRMFFTWLCHGVVVSSSQHDENTASSSSFPLGGILS